MDLFLSFDGRIGRKGFWMGLLGVIGLALVAAYVAGALGPGSAAAQIAQLVLSATIAWGWAAILVKRLHDRNKPALPWVAIFMAPGLVLSVIATFQIGYVPWQLGETEIMLPGRAFTYVSWISTAVGFWVVVEMGCLKGTAGPNGYGPDPRRASMPAEAV